MLVAMGSMIHLAVGKLEIDWGKNNGFRDHSALFQQSDVSDVPYYGYSDLDGSGEYNTLTCEWKEGLAKPLSEVVERINLLGYTMEYARQEFDYLSDLNDFDSEAFSFDRLAEALATVDVEAISPDYGEGGEDFGKFFWREVAERLGFSRSVEDETYVSRDAAEGMENLSAYTVLQLLARNPKAAALPVTWQYAEVEAGGWANRADFVKPLDATDSFLIVTEGHIDAGVIRHALLLMKPHLRDFFAFADMNEGYPFTGTGNLHNFTKGLVSIAVQNNVMVLYDNDAEGVASFARTQKLKLLPNMRVLKLPDLPQLENFRTIGPTGPSTSNINGSAAAIECYLDVGPQPVVRWTNFNAELGVYQGELLNKRAVSKRFFELDALPEDYEVSKILAVLDLIISTAIELRQAFRMQSLQRHSSEEGT